LTPSATKWVGDLINAINIGMSRFIHMKQYTGALALMAFLWSFSVNAQLSKKNKSHELGMMMGGGYYIGELNPHNKNMFRNSSISGGLSYRNNLTRRLGIKLSAIYGNVEYWDKNSSDPWMVNRNLNFRNRFYEFSAVGEVNYFDYQMNSKDWISPYLFGGIAYYMMNPEGYVQGSWITLQTMATEGQGTNTGNQYRLNSISMPFGAGLKVNIKGALGFSLEWGIRKTWTDYFDDVSTVYTDPKTLLSQQGQLSVTMADQSIISERGLDSNQSMQRGDPANKDYYGFLMASLNIRLDKPATNCYK
jgi:hypothetical protein